MMDDVRQDNLNTLRFNIFAHKIRTAHDIVIYNDPPCPNPLRAAKPIVWLQCRQTSSSIARDVTYEYPLTDGTGWGW